MIESLRKAAEERVSLLWQEAEAEAGRIRAEAGGRREQFREEANRKQTVITRNLLAQEVSEARSKARNIRLSAEKALSDRMYRTAASSLPLLRNTPRYDALFGVMARELPSRSWQTVHVNPRDAELAKKYFPGAEIVTDADITGGMDVSADSGAIRVINTFEKRLERAWSDLEPPLIKDAYQEVTNEASASAPGGPGISGGIPADEDQRQTVPPDI